MLLTIVLTALLIQTPDKLSPEVEYGKKSTLGRYIESPNVSERNRAYNYALNSIIGIRQQKLKPYLVHVVRMGAPPKNELVGGDEEEYSTRRVAQMILSQWHDSSLIPLFLEYINYHAIDPNKSHQYYGLGKEPLQDHYAAVKGLINIGQLALEPTLHELIKCEIPDERINGLAHQERANIIHRYKNLIYVIWCILDFDGAKNYFTMEIKKLEKTDPESTSKLRYALRHLETNYHK
ncbi:MAG: hypothetical protein QM703_16105 [Gemmatales bacterium]